MPQEIGNAYLNVVPKTDGNFARELESAGGTSGDSFGMAFSVAAGNIISQSFSQLVDFAVSQFERAFDNYANYEQLAGGVEKIFNEANIDQIFEDANNAYKELNLSANQYLEAVNQVGATFAATMGDQKGYDTARRGMLAVSDYATGTGRDLDELNEKYKLITRSSQSYQSIADQFSGILPQTSSDFLQAAQAAGFLSSEYQKLTDVPIAEYQAAVTAMLEKGVADMGLAGNTLMESTETTSGSIAMLQASWDNFLTSIFDPELNPQERFADVLSSLEAVANNVLPVLDNLLVTVFGEENAARIEHIAEVVRSLADDFSPVLTMALEFLGTVIDISIQNLDALASAIEWVRDAAYQLRDALDSINPVAGSVVSSAFGPIFGGRTRHYATGGYVQADEIYRAGERGGELVWPSYEPYLSLYAEALSERMGGGQTAIYVTVTARGDEDAYELGRQIGNAASYELRMQGVSA